MLLGDIHLQVFGPGLSEPEHGLKVHPSRLSSAGGDGPTTQLPRVEIERLSRDTVGLVYRAVHTISDGLTD
jgi:hypothetical protein